ncbi:DUF6907 domain-containing protein [Streptomyces mesophilus]|uniref:DUF6907 domain-containing protein n=1 Tax=Streptomyces mesophilus TaxID=1775132 RepID=UPI00332223A3
MSVPQTVTVHTRDHGSVTIAEPAWCLGVHVAGGFRADIEHAGEDVELLVDTARGQARLLTACVSERPFSPTDTSVFVAVELGCDWHPFSSETLADLVDQLVIHALGTLRPLVRKLRALEGEAP